MFDTLSYSSVLVAFSTGTTAGIYYRRYPFPFWVAMIGAVASSFAVLALVIWAGRSSFHAALPASETSTMLFVAITAAAFLWADVSMRLFSAKHKDAR